MGSARQGGVVVYGMQAFTNYLLDVPPDMSGQLPLIFVERMKEVGKLLKASDWPGGVWNEKQGAEVPRK